MEKKTKNLMPVMLYEGSKIIGKLMDYVEDMKEYRKFWIRLKRNQYKPVEIEIKGVKYTLKNLEF